MKTIMMLALSLAVIAPGVSVAADQADVNSVAVSYGDLNLSTSQGAATLLKRVDRAALKACGVSGFSLREYRQGVRRSDCYDQAMSHAVATLDLPVLTAHYNSGAKSGLN